MPAKNDAWRRWRSRAWLRSRGRERAGDTERGGLPHGAHGDLPSRRTSQRSETHAVADGGTARNEPTQPLSWRHGDLSNERTSER